MISSGTVPIVDRPAVGVPGSVPLCGCFSRSSAAALIPRFFPGFSGPQGLSSPAAFCAVPLWGTGGSALGAVHPRVCGVSGGSVRAVSLVDPRVCGAVPRVFPVVSWADPRVRGVILVGAWAAG